jgi:hypothetical protein
LLVTDSDVVHVETLRRRFGHLENVEVETLDPVIDLPPMAGFDSALLLDGLQRADEPKELLAHVASYVRSGGNVLIQVPADHELFGATDRAVGHLRRFSAEELEDVVRAAGLEVVSLEAFNKLGRLGWRVHHALGAAAISVSEARAFDLIVPVARRLDDLLPGGGLSYLAVARVP